jgi:hypothetical protein
MAMGAVATPDLSGIPKPPPRRSGSGGGEAVVVLVLRAGAAMVAFVGVALVASCRHGDWMEFARYPEYRYLLGASAVACVYSAAQALRNFFRGYTASPAFLDFAGDQVTRVHHHSRLSLPLRLFSIWRF